jgi:purine-binding chemotaxis protein CheW
MSELHVLFRVGRAEYAVPARDVAQLEAYSGATPVPGAAASVAGIVQVRGRVVPVVDLRVCFGLDPIEPTPDSRLVIARVPSRTVGLLVDSAREVAVIGPDQIEPPPSVIAAGSRGLVRAVARFGGRMVLMVDVLELIGQEQGQEHVDGE